MKKGQIFSLDVMLAITVVIILIASSVYFFTNSDESFLSNLQMIKASSDIVSILEETGEIDTLSSTIIQTKITELLPINYGMRLIINTTKYAVPIIIETQQDISEKDFIASGKQFFVFEKENKLYQGSIKYEVWPI